MGEQKVEEVKPIEVNRVEKWEVEKIYNEKNCQVLNKLERVCSRIEEEERTRKTVTEFKRRLSIEVKRQKN